jgi:hypothetical protein
MGPALVAGLVECVAAPGAEGLGGGVGVGLPLGAVGGAGADVNWRRLY